MTLTELLAALLTAGLPLFLLSLALVSWALHQGWLAGETVKELQLSLEALAKTQKDKHNSQRIDAPLVKWFRFGGGFYGLVALYTWLLVEWEDVADFLGGLADIVVNIDAGGLVGLLIELFIESMMNFVTAIAWPAYWLGQSRGAWVMLFVAYAGYWLGIKAALYGWRRGWVSNVIGRVAALPGQVRGRGQ